MKSFTLVFIFTLLVVAVVAQERKICDTPDDCEDTECCLWQSILRRGKCTPIAKQDESCTDTEDIFLGKYSTYCPCEAGLQCEIVDLDTPVGDLSLDKTCVAEDSVTNAEETEAPAEE